MTTSVLYWILKRAQGLLGVLAIWAALNLRTPLLAGVRADLLWLLPLGIIGVLLIDTPRLWRRSKLNTLKSASRWLILGLCSVSLTIFVSREISFYLTKAHVLQQDVSQLNRLGQHIVVGYRDVETVKTLIEKDAIGGVFITLRNIEGKSADTIRAEIASLQALRSQRGLPPLWIATDQEGGIVSRLSPPLPQLPALAEWISSAQTASERQQLAQDYGDQQGQGLADLGVNLNFAPVVDLNKGIVNPDDRFSVIYRRAISADKAVVTEVAQTYCAALAAQSVRCTLKHFPGLGRLETDTHLASAHLDTPIAELAEDDWVPFQQIMQQSDAFTMLGHPVLTAVDPQHPASFSDAVVNQILRQQWRHEGILITDDFSMGAVFKSADGVAGAVVKALQSGIDLILISFDTDLYYSAMAALIEAEQQQLITPEQLNASRDRLQQNYASLIKPTQSKNPPSSQAG
ncbi:MAG: glycoside hydrolase family 3 N-terminal domain-containing protein [Leptolyngbyaceae cyanobacterium]